MALKFDITSYGDKALSVLNVLVFSLLRVYEGLQYGGYTFVCNVTWNNHVTPEGLTDVCIYIVSCWK